MVDIARLGIEIDTGDLKDTQIDLRKTGDAAEGMERRVKGSARGTSKALRDTSKGASGLGRSARKLVSGNSLRNTAQQLNQVAQQGQVTGNYLGALATQLPDILGGFGMLGIVAGAAAGFLAPLVIGILEGSENSKSFRDRLDQLNDSVESYSDLVKGATSDTDDLVKKFGDAAGEARAVYKVLAENRRLQLAGETGALLRSEADPFGLEGTLKGLQSGKVADFFDLDRSFFAVGESAKAARKETDALTGAVIDAANAMNISGAGNDLDAQAAAARDMLNAFVAAADASGDRSEEEREYIANLGEAIIKIRELQELDKKLLDQAEQRAAITPEPGVSAPANADPSQVAETAAALAEINELWAGFQSFLNQDFPGMVLPFNNAIKSMASETERVQQEIPANLNRAIAQFPEIAISAREGASEIGQNIVLGAIAGIEANIPTLLTRARSMAQRVSQTVRAELDIQSPSRVFEEIGGYVSEGFARGIERNAHMAADASVTMANAAKEASGANGFVDLLTNSFSKVGDGWDSVVDNFKQGLRQMASDLIRSGIKDLLTNLFTPKVGGGGGFLGKLFGGLFDGGGSIRSGQFGIVGERGPEIVTGPAHVTSRKDTAKLMQGGGNSVVQLVLSPDLEARILQQASDQSVQITQAGIGANNRAISKRQNRPGFA